MAMEALQTTKKMSCRRAAKLYDVPESTLRDRINGRSILSERWPKSHNLSELEEEVLI